MNNLIFCTNYGKISSQKLERQGDISNMDTKFTTEQYLDAANAIAKSSDKNLDMVIYFLEKAGMCDDEFMDLVDNRKTMNENDKRGRKKVLDPEFMDLLRRVYEANNNNFNYFATLVNTQKSRLFNWMVGINGITEEKKNFITEVANTYLSARERALAEVKASNEEDKYKEEKIMDIIKGLKSNPRKKRKQQEVSDEWVYTEDETILNLRRAYLEGVSIPKMAKEMNYGKANLYQILNARTRGVPENMRTILDEAIAKARAEIKSTS